MFVQSLRRVRDRALGRHPRICFPHVPKCAGSALTAAIGGQYPLSLRALGQTLRINLRGSQRAADATATPMHRVRESVLAYQLANPSCFFASGHVACRPAVTQAFAGEWRFLTVLRDPVERWISNYVYDRHKASEWARIDVDIEEYVESDAGRMNGMAYLFYFSNLEALPPQGGHPPFVREAVENLRTFSLVGCAERMDATVEEFARCFGRPLRLRRTNSSPEPQAKAAIKNNATLLAKIEKLCEPDQQLYNEFFPGSPRE